MGASDTNTLAFMNGNSSCLAILFYFILFFKSASHEDFNISHVSTPRFPGCKNEEDKKTKWLNPKELVKKGQNKSEAIGFLKGVKHLRID